MKSIPDLYRDLSAYDKYELNNFVSDVIDVMTQAEVEGGFEDGAHGFTYAEIRNLLETHYDKEYDPSDRHLERKPTQREVNFVIEAMLCAPDSNDLVLREKDGLIYMISEDEREAIDDANHETRYNPGTTQERERPMKTFAERRAALEKLGWQIDLESEYRGKPGVDRERYGLELFDSVRLPLTPRDWCRLCMREGEQYLAVETEEGTRYERSEYIGGCCGNMSAVQDVLNGWFRDGGWVEAHELVALGEAMRDHGDKDFEDIQPDELAKRVETFLEAEDKPSSAWTKLSLLYHLVKDHYKPKIFSAQSLRSDELEGAFRLVSRMAWTFGMGDFFTRESPLTNTTKEAQKVMRLYRFMPAFKLLYERARELVPEPIEGWALVDLQKGEGEVAENGYGYCIYATKPEAQRILDLMENARSQYKERPPRDLEKFSLKIRAVRVSLDKGIEFLDEGEEPKPRIKWERRPSWLKEDVEDVEMLFKQYCQERSLLLKQIESGEYNPVYEEAQRAWEEAARFFGGKG